MRAAIVAVAVMFCGCSAARVNLPAVRETVTVRVVPESGVELGDSLEHAAAFMRTAGVEVQWTDEDSAKIHLGIKRREWWRNLIGYHGLAYYTENRILVWVGPSDVYNGRLIAHEIGHCLGAAHDIRGVMHTPIYSGWIVPFLSGFDFATGFSTASINEMNARGRDEKAVRKER